MLEQQAAQSAIVQPNIEAPGHCGQQRGAAQSRRGIFEESTLLEGGDPREDELVRAASLSDRGGPHSEETGGAQTRHRHTRAV